MDHFKKEVALSTIDRETKIKFKCVGEGYERKTFEFDMDLEQFRSMKVENHIQIPGRTCEDRRRHSKHVHPKTTFCKAGTAFNAPTSPKSIGSPTRSGLAPIKILQCKFYATLFFQSF